MSSDESLFYVVVSSVFHNVHFRHIVGLKTWLLIIRQQVLLKSMILDILVLGLEISSKTPTFSF